MWALKRHVIWSFSAFAAALVPGPSVSFGRMDTEKNAKTKWCKRYFNPLQVGIFCIFFWGGGGVSYLNRFTKATFQVSWEPKTPTLFVGGYPKWTKKKGALPSSVWCKAILSCASQFLTTQPQSTVQQHGASLVVSRVDCQNRREIRNCRSTNPQYSSMCTKIMDNHFPRHFFK